MKQKRVQRQEQLRDRVHERVTGTRWLSVRSRKGMELVQVAILVAIAVGLGLIFKTQITDFVNNTFAGLQGFN